MNNIGGPRDPNSPYDNAQAQQEQRREEVTRGFAASNRPGSWKIPVLLVTLVVILVGLGLFFAYFH